MTDGENVIRNKMTDGENVVDHEMIRKNQIAMKKKYRIYILNTVLRVIIAICLLWIIAYLISVIGSSKHMSISYYIDKDYWWIDLVVVGVFLLAVLCQYKLEEKHTWLTDDLRTRAAISDNNKQ